MKNVQIQSISLLIDGLLGAAGLRVEKIIGYQAIRHNTCDFFGARLQ